MYASAGIPVDVSLGRVAERLNAPVLKTGRRESVSWVQIPPRPLSGVSGVIHDLFLRMSSAFCLHEQVRQVVVRETHEKFELLFPDSSCRNPSILGVSVRMRENECHRRLSAAAR